MTDRARARRHLEALASAPRPAAGHAEARARAYCADVLRALHFDVTEETFEYSTIPGRFATPVGGALSIVALGAAGHIGYRGHALTSLGILVGFGTLIAIGAMWMARHGVLAVPWGRARSANLVATRGEPAMWLVAHLDSKSQPVPILVRGAGIVITILVWVLALAVAGSQLGGARIGAVWPWISAIGWIAGLPILLSVVGRRSAGAVDDASGVAAVLLAAEALPPDRSLGVVLTSAEELGLAGARAWVRGRAAGRAVNVDGIDDVGVIRLTYTGSRPASLIDALTRCGAAQGLDTRAGPLVPGALLDGVALADSGWDVVTVSRGTLGTVARVHTPRDDLARLDGIGVAAVARVIACAIEEPG